MTRRNQSLDVLRGVAVLLVVSYHYTFSAFENPLSKFGWAGVDLFFVLSGFLVSGLLFREYQSTRSIDLKRFIIRRGFKIWPAFYFYLAVMALLTLLSWRDVFPWRTFVDAATFIRNYRPHFPIVFLHTWSLAVEEHFYIALALLFVFIRRSTRRFESIPYIWAVTVIGCMVARGLTPLPLAETASHCRIDTLFTGVTVSYFYHFKPDLFRRFTGWSALLISAFCLSPFVIFRLQGTILRIVGYPVIAIGFALLLCWSVGRTPSGATAKAISFVGVHSYSIYLWQFIAAFLTAFLPWYVGFPAYIIVAVGIGVAAARIVELPMLRVRDKMFPNSPTDSPQSKSAPAFAFHRPRADHAAASHSIAAR